MREQEFIEILMQKMICCLSNEKQQMEAQQGFTEGKSGLRYTGGSNTFIFPNTWPNDKTRVKFMSAYAEAYRTAADAYNKALGTGADPQDLIPFNDKAINEIKTILKKSKNIADFTNQLTQQYPPTTGILESIRNPDNKAVVASVVGMGLFAAAAVIAAAAIVTAPLPRS